MIKFMSNRKNKRSVTSSGGRKKRRITDRRNKEYECDPDCKVLFLRGEQKISSNFLRGSGTEPP